METGQFYTDLGSLCELANLFAEIWHFSISNQVTYLWMALAVGNVVLTIVKAVRAVRQKVGKAT